MKKAKIEIKIVLFLMLNVSVLSVRVIAQGTFQNLDFENATVIQDPNNNGFVYADSAIPGWTATADLTQGGKDIIFNTLSGSVSAISIHDAQSNYQPIQGSYSVILQGAQTAAGFSDPASISQTGLVPANAQSLQFVATGGNYNFQVTLGGQTLSLTPLTTTPTYTLWGANIAWAAGTSSTLQFTALPNGFIMLDGIQFSTSPAPEPSTIALLAIGAIIIVSHKRKRSRSDG